MDSKEKRVVMTRRVAGRWLHRIAQPEFRLRVLYGAREIRNLASLLESFRDGRVAMAAVPKIANLGIRADFDGIELWSSDREGILALESWFEKRGFETTGVW